MPSVPSPLLRLEVQSRGENLNAWGDKLNDVVLQLEQSIASVLPLSITGNRALTADNFLSNEYRRAAHILNTGSGLAAAFAITVPPVSSLYHVVNLTAYPATYTTGAGTGAVIRPGRNALVLCDGTDCRVWDPSLDQIRAPAANVAMGGRTFTGLPAPTADDQPATRASATSYTDGKRLNGFQTPNANIAMGGFTFNGLPNGANGSQQPATVKQVETLINASSGSLFPVQAGHAGEFLTTDGTTPSFRPLRGLAAWLAMIS